MTTLVCPKCKALVDVVNKIVASHDIPDKTEKCSFSGASYTPSKVRTAGGPEFEVLVTRIRKVEDRIEIQALVRRTTEPDTTN